MVGFFTLIAAVLAAVYAKKAAEAAEKSISHSLDTAHAELRAYLVSAEETLTVPEEGDSEFKMVVCLRNAGSTPANGVAVEVEPAFMYRNGGTCWYPICTYGSNTMSPGALSDFHFSASLEEDEMRALKAGKGDLTAHIRASFTDNFGVGWVYEQLVAVNKESLSTNTLYTRKCAHTKVQPVKDGTEAKPKRKPLALPSFRKK